MPETRLRSQGCASQVTTVMPDNKRAKKEKDLSPPSFSFLPLFGAGSPHCMVQPAQRAEPERGCEGKNMANKSKADQTKVSPSPLSRRTFLGRVGVSTAVAASAV